MRKVRIKARTLSVLGMLLVLAVIATAFSGCSKADSLRPCIEVHRTKLNLDTLRIYSVTGMEVDEKCPYETVETENGKDVVLHFVYREEKENERTD